MGGGSAGVTVAARLRRAGQEDIAVIDPATTHYYQPLWTLVGGGRAPIEKSARPQASVMPKGVRWIKQAAAEIDPDGREITLDDGGTVGYDYWSSVRGSSSTGRRSRDCPRRSAATACPATTCTSSRPPPGTSSATPRRAPPSSACPRAPSSARERRRRSPTSPRTTGASRACCATSTSTWSCPRRGCSASRSIADVLAGVARRYGITVHFESEVTEVRPDRREAVVADRKNDTTTTLPYDVMHLVPPQSAPDWIKKSPLADAANPAGYVEIDKNSMQHVRYPNVFSLGDAGSSPNSKTGAAVRQASPRRRGQPAQRDGRQAAHRVLRRLRVVPADHGEEEDTARRVRLLDEADPDDPLIDTLRNGPTWDTEAGLPPRRRPAHQGS